MRIQSWVSRRAVAAGAALALLTGSAVAVNVLDPPSASGASATTMIAAGYTHSCMIRSGTAYCWGDNTYGELGNDSKISSNVPAAVYTGGALSGVTLTQIVTGNGFTCGLSSGGSVYCWGYNAYGDLGNNTALNSKVPVAVSQSGALSGVTVSQISAGGQSVCALSSAGAAYCWGAGGLGQLGNGGTSDSSVPVAVTASGTPISGLTLSQVSVGAAHACALSSAGAVYCWGDNADGDLGNDSTAQSSTAVAVSTSGVLAGATVSQISAGYQHTCALDTTGAGYCWGLGGNGQLGNSDTSNSSVPVAVTATGVLSGASLSQLTAGQYHTCALDTSGTAYCWGLNSSGQDGNTTTAVNFSAPVVVSPSQPSTVAAGYSHACMIQAGQAYCWGDNTFGELGNNSTTASSVPVAVDTGGVLSGVTLTQIVTGFLYTCALSSTGAAYCWGFNGVGELGNSSTTNSDVPVAVDTSGALSGLTLTQMSGGFSQTCVLSSTSVAYCWGYNDDGELGDGNTTSSDTAVAVTASGVLSGLVIAAVYAGNGHGCAVSTAGAPYCWGDDTDGALGDNPTSSTVVTTPVAVDTAGVLSGVYVTAMALGIESTCALGSNGLAYCWGENIAGDVGDGSTTPTGVPVAVTTSGALSGVTLAQIGAGTSYACAESTAGAAYCWGDNSDGELGNNDSSVTSSTTPVAVYMGGALSGLTLLQLAAGTLTTCTLNSSGAVYCWGEGTSGQLGNNMTSNSYTAAGVLNAMPSFPPGSLEMAAPSSLTWGASLNGVDQSIVDSASGDQQITVDDGTGSGAGWQITMSATTFTTGARSLPDTTAMDVTGSTSSLTSTAPSASCVSTCTLPTDTTTYPVDISTAASSPTAYTIYDTSAGTGEGGIVIGGSSATDPIGWWINVPASAYEGSYTSTITLNLVSGP